jgi:hypothetical protein
MHKKCFKYSHKYVTLFLEICQIYASSTIYVFNVFYFDGTSVIGNQGKSSKTIDYYIIFTKYV